MHIKWEHYVFINCPKVYAQASCYTSIYSKLISLQMVTDGPRRPITNAESNLMQLCSEGKLTNMDINRWDQSFQLESTLLTNAHLHFRLTSPTSNAAFCTVIWLKTLAPSGQTVFSSSLLREKSCAPFNTPRLLTVLKKKKKKRHKEIED